MISPKTIDTAGNVVQSTHRATRENGPNVVNGELVWTSASGITTADTSSYGGCLRRWFIEQVLELKGPETDAMRGGTALHAEIENRLRTAAPLQTPLALSGARFIPHPGGNLQIERPIHFKTKTGINIFGHVDLYNFRQEYIDEEGALQRDPSWSFEVKDWKTTASFEYAKTAQQLAENIQLVTYAEAGYRIAPDMEHSRLTHVYFRTRGAPASRLVTILRDREQIGARWEYAESVVRSMADAAREKNVEKVPGNRAACDAYRGCPHRSTCSVYKFNSLDALFNKVAGDHLQEKSRMGIIANNPGLMQQQGAQAPTQAAPQATTQQQLAQEEAALRTQVAQQQQQMPMPQAAAQNAGADLLTVCYELGQAGYGFPKLVGNAAMAYAQASGQNVAPGFEYAGMMAPAGAKRSLHTLPLSEVAHIYQLAREIAAERAQQAIPQMIPPAAHLNVSFAPTPAQPQAQYVPPPTTVLPNGAQVVHAVAGTPAGAPISFLAPGAPQSMPQLAQAAPAAAPVEEKPKKKRGRPAAEASVANTLAPSTGTAPEVVVNPPQTTQTAVVTQASTPPAPTAQVTPAAAPTYQETAPAPQCAETEAGWGSVLINARFASKATKSLAGYVDYINGELAKRYSVTSDGKPGIQDVRCTPKDSPLAYGGWKGAVREVVKADPPPQGDYHLDTFNDELNEVVADALRVVAEQRGWIYVRGIGR